jgi:hypothetical protein
MINPIPGGVISFKFPGEEKYSQQTSMLAGMNCFVLS